ncbi:hypothetical protein [Chitinimonas lacunae]|uniref:Uncharacterized protein n=1 Tax=Chitinimonas lacunae TaxID=1963018 RepID=A0ABV8MT77_9NEIS
MRVLLVGFFLLLSFVLAYWIVGRSGEYSGARKHLLAIVLAVVINAGFAFLLRLLLR